MRLRINYIALGGTSRKVSFKPGLNIITGPIASGKTTLFRFIRCILGGSLDDLTPEARTVVAALGEMVIGETTYSVIRPIVTTRNAPIDIATKNMAVRLPLSGNDSEARQTYLQWLLETLELPRLQVPSAPTKPESEPTPVSIRDYLSYCTLTQAEIGEEIFSHKDPIRNIKRKYVFEIIYGIYNVEMAQIQDELRDVQVELRELKNQDRLFYQFLKDTVLENRADIERKLKIALENLENIESDILKMNKVLESTAQSAQLKTSAFSAETEVQKLINELETEKRSAEDIGRLSAQLQTQASRITKSIVAEKHLGDIDFVICPRCGNAVASERAEEEKCYLCLQVIKPELSHQSLIEEQARIEAQLQEAEELLVSRQNNIVQLKKELSAKQDEEYRIKKELDFQTRAFVSPYASQIAFLATKRAEVKIDVDKYNEYLKIFQKFDQVQKKVNELEMRKEDLQQQLEAAMGKEETVKSRIDYLNEQYNNTLEGFRPPLFGEQKNSIIDRRTYLPEYHGRRFDEISSPGLATLVSVAYLIAHQKTSIHFNLGLPNILLIDGLSEHLGKEGFDPERQEAVYQYLIQMSEELGDILQIIIVDNEVPAIARKFIRLELSESERLITI